MGIARQFMRREYFDKGEKSPRTLDTFNDSQKGSAYLHATKGWKTISPKRSIATRIVAEIKQGARYKMEGIQTELAGAE